VHNRYKILIVFTVLTGALFSQLQVKNYFSVTGKKDVPVNTIIQDFTGFLWLGTAEGLYKFDGKSAVIAVKDNSALKKEISALYFDSDETLWIGTKAGKVYFIKKNQLDSISFAAMPNMEKITSFIEVTGGICIGTYGSGIYTYCAGKLLHFYTGNGLSDNVIYKITGDKKNVIWCGTDAGITQVVNITARPEFKIISNKNGLPDNIVRDINLEDNRLLISMQDSGVCYYNIAKAAIERNPFFINWTLGTVINATQTKGKLTLATEKNGLLQIEKGAFYLYNYNTYLQTTSINQLFIDKAHQLWIASKKGISQFNDSRYSFISAANGLTDDKVLALATDNDNAVWVGTTTGISRIMNNEEGKVTVEKIQSLEKYTISCAARAPNGDIWFGTYGNGIIVFRTASKTSVIINSENAGLPNGNVSNIFFTDKNTVYISTLGGGLAKVHVELERKVKLFNIDKIYKEAVGLGSDYVYAAITDNKEKLYVATDGGGLQMLENDKFIDLTKKFNFNSNTIFSLCKDKYNNIWAASNANGILKYNGKTLISITAANGLRDEQPQQLIAYDNTIFAVNSKGIDKINCQTNAVSYYDVSDKDLEPNLNAIFLNKDKIYSGTTSGVLAFRANQELQDSVKPVVYIKSFQLNYKPFPLDSIYEFKHNQNNISLTFDGIWLKNPDKLLYRYRLAGFEAEWLYSGEGETVNYNNLGPGNYTFIVQAKNEEDVWSEPAGYSFIILTPVWKRWWFWVLLVGLTALSMYVFVKYRLKALQRENLLLEQRVAERTYEIEKQSKIIEVKNKELEQLSLVASKTDNVVLILDADGRLEYINESFEKRNKISIEELKKDHGETIYEISNYANIKEIIQEAVTHKKSVSYESLNKKTDPSANTWESSTLTPLFDDEGNLKKIIIIDTDVTERKKQEQIIVQKNKDITDSISYAKKIQHAILPRDFIIKATLPNSFVLYMTKDIVSGDFYWFTHIDNCCIIAAVDCTGHGVPGAFMSLIGYNLLNRIVNEKRITDPKDILMELNNGVLNVLHKNESESKDGMDIAICKINYDLNTLDYAGAMRPIWIINNGVLKEIRADKIPIGTKQKDRRDTITYTTHTIALDKGDSFYIFTDGYADQFGGPKDKKYSTARFKELLIKNATEDFSTQEKNIKAEHQQWKGENEQIDDILVIGFSV
jgi:ligand-binding sensor domain-containing protein/serine phosphatase RsbU (regulator of sigma subunit)/PAS domain-containing protein